MHREGWLLLQQYGDRFNASCVVQDGVLGSGDASSDEGASQEPHVLPANPRHEAASVETALRWAMGMSTMMPLDVHACAGVLR